MNDGILKVTLTIPLGLLITLFFQALSWENIDEVIYIELVLVFRLK